MSAPTEQQNAALATFVACVVEGLNPTLTAHTKPVNGEAEYDVLIGGRGLQGVIHEDIETVLHIATEHGGRAFIHHADKLGEGCLCIVWPGRRPDGPDPAGEHAAQAESGRRKP